MPDPLSGDKTPGTPRRWLHLTMLLAALAGTSLCVARALERPPADEVGAEPTAPPASAGALAGGTPSIRWIERGSRLMVDGRWVLRPADGTWVPLPYATARPLEGGGTELLGMSLSWNGEQVVLWDQREFSFGPAASKLNGPFPLPVLHPWLLEGTTAPGYISQVLFWASEHQLILYQFAPMEDAEPSCRIFDTVTRSWQPVAQCPWGSFLEVEQIDPGPGGWVAVYSAAEGSSSLLLAHYDPDSGQRQAGAPEFNLYPMGSIHAQFSLDGSRVALSTSCLLHEEQAPCAGTEESERWRMYSWLIKEKRLVLVREDLPSHAIPAPDGERMAWHMRDRVCLSRLFPPEQKKCFCLPNTRPASCTPG